MVSTKENGVLCNGHLHVGGYGYQIATYRYDDGEIIDLQDAAQIIPKRSRPVSRRMGCLFCWWEDAAALFADFGCSAAFPSRFENSTSRDLPAVTTNFMEMKERWISIRQATA